MTGGAGETAARALIEGLAAYGVEVIFGNLGSDHTALIDALAELHEQGARVPAVVLAPHEASALAAAHGYALVRGRAQAVFVHVDVGTANLGGAVHNAARARVPVLLFAGLTPYTMEGEHPGTRNSYPNHLQDIPDQHGIVRPYVKWSYDLRTGANARQLVSRALQLAESSPQGPVYLTGAREVLASVSSGREVDAQRWRAIEPAPLPSSLVDAILAAVAGAEFPLLVTSSLGRDPDSVEVLVELAETLGIGVVEAVPDVLSFPADHELHVGFMADPLLSRADVVIVVDSYAPWMPARATPRDDARIFVLGADPLNERTPLWYLEAEAFARTDSPVALRQLRDAARHLADRGDAESRRARLAAEHAAQRDRWRGEREGGDGRLTVPLVCAALERALDPSTIVLNEAISNAEAVFRHLPRSRPGTRFASGGSSLGWSSAAAVGIKLAQPDATVVSIVGDGSYFLSEPSSSHWMAHRYGAPFLTVILDNGGWNATKQNVIRQHPEGPAASGDRFWVNLAQEADLPGVAAAAGGAYAATASTAAELEEQLRLGLDAVASGRAAVISERLAPISDQRADKPAARGRSA